MTGTLIQAREPCANCEGRGTLPSKEWLEWGEKWVQHLKTTPSEEIQQHTSDQLLSPPQEELICSQCGGTGWSVRLLGLDELRKLLGAPYGVTGE